jgi:hypothetical protein
MGALFQDGLADGTVGRNITLILNLSRLESVTPAFERTKTVHALDCAATVIGISFIYVLFKNVILYVHYQSVIHLTILVFTLIKLEHFTFTDPNSICIWALGHLAIS